MRNIGKVSLALVGFVLLVVMCLGSLPLTAQAQGNVPQKVLFEQVVELPLQERQCQDPTRDVSRRLQNA